MYYAYFGKAVLYLAFGLTLLSMLLQVLNYFMSKYFVARIAKFTFIVSAGFVFLSFLSFVLSYLTGAYDIESVYNHCSEQMTIIEKIGATWTGANGSLLFFTMILFLVSLLQFYVKEKITRKYSLLILSALGAFFLFLILFLGYNPFIEIKSENLEKVLKNEMLREMQRGGGDFLDKADIIESYDINSFDGSLENRAASIVEYEHAHGRSIFINGRGLRPSLRSVYNMIHPISIYLGFIFLFPAFAMLLNYMMLRIPTIIWNLKMLRIWLLSSFIFLAIGNVLGGLWAYVEFGWGGFWAWDPVENASLIPCLLSLAALHSLWNLKNKSNFNRSVFLFSFLAFLTSIWGMWVTRSGASISVHDYAGDNPTISYALLSLLGASIFFILLVVGINIVKSRRNRLTEKFKKTGLQNYFVFFNLTIFLLATIIFILSYASIFTKLLFDTEFKVHAYFITAPFFILLFVLLTIASIKYFRIARFRIAMILASVCLVAFLYFQMTDSPFGIFALLKSKTVIEAAILRLTPVILTTLFVFNIVISVQLIIRILRQKLMKNNVIARLGAIGIHLGTLMFASGIAMSALMSYPTVSDTIILGEDEIQINTGFPTYLNPKYKIIAYEIGFALDSSNYESSQYAGNVDADRFNIVNSAEFPLAYFYEKDAKFSKSDYLSPDSFLNVFTEDSHKSQQMDAKTIQMINSHLTSIFELNWTKDKKRYYFNRNFKYIQRYFRNVVSAKSHEFNYLYYRFWVRIETDFENPVILPMMLKIYNGFESELHRDVTIRNSWTADIYLAPLSPPDENGNVSVVVQIKSAMLLVRTGIFVILFFSLLLAITFFKRE
ncbi:MAG: cytochrome c biogenesis protein CcsA [Planctomycetes bacterium]|nr:cytochrome c biogenesis protein CcsA [Planctomycetota bacterium]